MPRAPSDWRPAFDQQENELRRLHADGVITNEEYQNIRSRRLKFILVMDGELGPREEPRRELGTAALIQREDNELYGKPTRRFSWPYRVARFLLPGIILVLTVTGCTANDGSNFMAAAVQRQNRPIDREEREGLSAAGAEIVSCGDPAPDPKISPCATVWRTCKRRDGKKVVAIMPNDPARCIQTDDVCQ